MREHQPKHRQAAKERRKLDRKKASRAGLPTALVVCEGKCSEPHYIKGLMGHLGVNAANVTVLPGEFETDALALVHRAHKAFAETPDFDRVFVVLDGDQKNLETARSLAKKRLRKTDRTSLSVELIVTNPCFEYWLLLHFEYTTSSMSSAEAGNHLQGHVTDYDKGDPRIFSKVNEGVELAVRNAQRARNDAAKSGAVGAPGSDMPVLVDALSGMRRL
jgi:hypothetical protein